MISKGAKKSTQSTTSPVLSQAVNREPCAMRLLVIETYNFMVVPLTEPKKLIFNLNIDNIRMLLQKTKGIKGASMESVTVNLPDQLASQIEEAAKQMGISPEEFIKAGIEEKLSLLDRDFHKAADHVLKKNAELYKRLA